MVYYEILILWVSIFYYNSNMNWRHSHYQNSQSCSSEAPRFIQTFDNDQVVNLMFQNVIEYRCPWSLVWIMKCVSYWAKILHSGVSFNAESEFGIHFVLGSTVTTYLVLMSRTDFEDSGSSSNSWRVSSVRIQAKSGYKIKKYSLKCIEIGCPNSLNTHLPEGFF